jgi:hypothetical protein
MEQLGMDYLLKLVKEFGLPGMIFLVWWLDQKSQTRLLSAYREDTQRVLADYKEDMAAQRLMYESNVFLVKQYGQLCGDLKEIVMLNAGQFQVLNKNIENNNFCPLSRVKKASGVPE